MLEKKLSRFPRKFKRLKCKPSVNYQCGGKCQPLKNNCKKMALGMAKNGLEYLKAVEERKARIAKVNAKRGGRTLFTVDDSGNVGRGLAGRVADPAKRVYGGAGTNETKGIDGLRKIVDDIQARVKEYPSIAINDKEFKLNPDIFFDPESQPSIMISSNLSQDGVGRSIGINGVYTKQEDRQWGLYTKSQDKSNEWVYDFKKEIEDKLKTEYPKVVKQKIANNPGSLSLQGFYRAKVDGLLPTSVGNHFNKTLDLLKAKINQDKSFGEKWKNSRYSTDFTNVYFNEVLKKGLSPLTPKTQQTPEAIVGGLSSAVGAITVPTTPTKAIATPAKAKPESTGKAITPKPQEAKTIKAMFDEQDWESIIKSNGFGGKILEPYEVNRLISQVGIPQSKSKKVASTAMALSKEKGLVSSGAFIEDVHDAVVSVKTGDKANTSQGKKTKSVVDALKQKIKQVSVDGLTSDENLIEGLSSQLSVLDGEASQLRNEIKIARRNNDVHQVNIKKRQLNYRVQKAKRIKSALNNAVAELGGQIATPTPPKTTPAKSVSQEKADAAIASPNPETKAKVDPSLVVQTGLGRSVTGDSMDFVLTPEQASNLNVQAKLKEMRQIEAKNVRSDGDLRKYKQLVDEVFLAPQREAILGVFSAGEREKVMAAMGIFTRDFKANNKNQAVKSNGFVSLRNIDAGKELRKKDDRPEFRDAVEGIRLLLSKAPKHQGSVYRGIRFSGKKTEENRGDRDKFLAELKEKGEMDLDAFSSFSTRQSVAEGFAGLAGGGADGTTSIIFRVNDNKSGVNVSAFSKVPDESEVLVPKNTRYKVVNIEENKIGYQEMKGSYRRPTTSPRQNIVYVDLEEIPNAPKSKPDESVSLTTELTPQAKPLSAQGKADAAIAPLEELAKLRTDGGSEERATSEPKFRNFNKSTSKKTLAQNVQFYAYRNPDKIEEVTDDDLIKEWHNHVIANAAIRYWDMFPSHKSKSNDVQIRLDQAGGADYRNALVKLLQDRGIFEIADNSYNIDFDAIKKDMERKSQKKKDDQKPTNFSEPRTQVKSHRQRIAKMRKISRQYRG